MRSRLIKLRWFLGIVCLIPCALVHAQQPSQEFVAKDIDFKTHDNLPMLGRLVLPESNAPRAVLIYVQTAEGATLDMKRPLGRGRTFNYFDIYRTKLTAMGVGFFSYEGRGIRMGDNPPRYESIDWAVYNTSTLANKVRDALAAIQAVRSQPSLQRIPILLMGTSEGTILAAEAASRNPEPVAGVVLQAVAATNLRPIMTYIMSDGDFLRYRALDENKDGVITQPEWEKLVKGQDFSKADLNKDGKFTVDDIKVATKKYLDAIQSDDYEVLHTWAKTSAAVSVPDGWFKDHFSYPEIWTFLSQLRMPVGLFHGEADNMTPVAAVRALESKARNAGLSRMEFHYFEGLDHSLKVGEYFVNGNVPKGHQAIFEFIDRVAPKPAKD